MHSKKRISFLLLAVVLLFLFTGSAFGAESEDSETIRVTFLDVGKGDCILIQKDSSAVLIDAGYQGTAPDVIAYLADRGIDALDCMIITHYDKDHVGGASQIAAALPVGQILLPVYEPDSSRYENLMDTIADRTLNARRVSEDVSFVLGDVAYSVFASSLEYDPEKGNDNDVSLVVTAEYGEDTFLFAGDIEKKGIKAYLAEEHGSFDVVKMPHHGRTEKNSDDLIADAAPQIAVITDSADDPAEDELLELLTDAGAEIYRSSVNGTIAVTGRGTGAYTVTTER